MPRVSPRSFSFFAPALQRLAFAILVALSAAPAAAVVSFDVWRSDISTVELGADRMAAAPGDEVRIVLKQTLSPGWHSYWINPGDTGMPTTIDWTAPEGVAFSDIAWPTPERQDYEPFVNFGFSNEVLLLSTMRVPEDWPAGEPIPIVATAKWLVCEQICIVEDHVFNLSVPTAAESAPDAEFVALAERAAESWPVSKGEIGRYAAEGDAITLRFPADALDVDAVENGFFFPEEPGIAASASPQTISTVDGEIIVEMRRSSPESFGVAQKRELTGRIPGVFKATTTAGETVSIHLTALGDGVGAAAAGGGGSGGGATQLAGGATMTLWAAAGLAFLGGLILNVMPCVFPVLALKAMSLVKTANQPRQERLIHTGAYTAGVVLSFLALAIALIAFKSAGGGERWGFHLQSPAVVGVLTVILFAVGLNFSGVFEFSGRAAGIGSSLAEKNGAPGAFFTGVLAVVVASPCTAPFMITALGYALTQDAATALVVFAALGLGFAAPLAALGLSPSLARLLPKPGPWMTRFRQALAFPMYAAAAVLLWVLAGLAGRDAALAAMIACVLVGAALWAIGSGAPSSVGGRRVAFAAAGLCLALAVGAFASWVAAPTGQPARASDQAATFEVAAIEAAHADGRTVFVNVTADWCISCKGNEWLVLKQDPVKAALVSDDVTYVEADWTRYDPAITAYLDSFEHPGVPLYVVYRDGLAPQVLPQLLTQDTVIGALGLSTEQN